MNIPAALAMTSTTLLATSGLAQITVDSTATIDPGLAPSGVAIADFNGDGLLDAAATVDGPGDVRILLGDGLGGLVASASINLPQNSGAGDLVAADFDGNGTADLAVVLKNLSSIAILLNGGAANFTLASTVTTGEDGSGPQTGDLDADGDVDLVVANSAVDTVSVLRNGGAANFTVIELVVGADPRGAAFGDFDAD
ncbi:MAG: FG-GAP repeat domain-containing protein, partial [Phycisphaerales bacterium]